MLSLRMLARQRAVGLPAAGISLELVDGVPKWTDIGVLADTSRQYPTPKTRRPPESTSRLANSFARTSGLRCGRMITPVPTRSVVVTAPAKVKGNCGIDDGLRRFHRRRCHTRIRQHHVLAGPQRFEAGGLGLLRGTHQRGRVEASTLIDIEQTKLHRWHAVH